MTTDTCQAIRTTAPSNTDVLVIGAGIIGIAVAHAVKTRAPRTRVTLIDDGQPMAFTSAQSGENYRNWWPHPVMKRLADDSIDLMESLSTETDDRIGLTRRGYALATRTTELEPLLSELAATYGEGGPEGLRVHDGRTAASYAPADSEDWRAAPSGVDVLCDAALVRRHFPTFDPSVTAVLHVRRAGTVASQQLGQHLLERFRALGGDRVSARVTGIERPSPFSVSVESDGVVSTFGAERIVNAAGPFVNEVAALLGVALPVHDVVQQKVAFEDIAGAIPRNLPFSIDLDAAPLGWSDEERTLLAEEPSLERFLGEMPGGIHCRAEGGGNARWIKLGWAYNTSRSAASRVVSASYSDSIGARSAFESTFSMHRKPSRSKRST